MSSVNKVILLGSLGRDPETRAMRDGTKIVHLSVATSERWRDKASGENKEKTEWHRVVIFNERLAEVAEKYLSKGKQVYLEGQLQTRKWTDQSGAERYSTEIVLQRFRGELVLLGGGRQDDDDDRANRSPSGVPYPRQAQPIDELDDEIPFARDEREPDHGARKAFV